MRAERWRRATRNGWFVLLPTLVACHSWRSASGPPGAFIAAERPHVVRLTRTNGSMVTLERPSVVGDSILGAAGGAAARAATADVKTLEVRYTSVPKTLALLVAHASAVVTFVAFVIDLQPHYRGF